MTEEQKPRMTRERLKEIEELTRDTVQGPWLLERYDGGYWLSSEANAASEDCGDIGQAWSETEAAFIVASRTAVPELVTEVEACWQERDALKAQLAEQEASLAEMRKALLTIAGELDDAIYGEVLANMDGTDTNSARYTLDQIRVKMAALAQGGGA